MGDEDEVLGSELHTSANAASDPNNNEANATTGWALGYAGATFTSVAAENGVSPNNGSYQFKFQAAVNGARYDYAFSAVSGKRYSVSLYAAHYQGNQNAYAYVATTNSGDNLGYILAPVENLSATAYTKYTFDFVSTQTGTLYLSIRQAGNSTPDNINYIDNISLKEIHTADATPNANNGTVYGASYTTDRHGQSNNALSFDGTDDYVSVPDGTSFDEISGTGDFSIFTWIKYASFAGDPQYTAVSQYSDTNNRWYFGARHNLMGFYYSSGTWTVVISEDPSNTTDVWYHIGITRSGNTWTLWKDGKQLGDSVTASDTIPNPTAAARFGYAQSAEDNKLDGSLDDIRIYNYALSAQEIKDLYGSYNPVIKASSLTKGLVGQWGLGDEDGGTGSTTFDMTPNANNGTRYGSTLLASMYAADRHSQSNNAMTFNGSDDYVDVADNAVFDFGTGDFSVSFWMKPTNWEGLSGDTAYMAILSNSWYLPAWDGFHFSRLAANWVDSNANGELVFNAGCYSVGIGNESCAVTSKTPLKNNIWYHVVGLRSSGTNYMYLNGLQTDSDPDSSQTVSVNRDFMIGRNPDTTYPRYFNGSISDIRIYNRALSAEEVKMMYDGY